MKINKKIYNTPIIERIAIDQYISLAMKSFTEGGGIDPDDPDDWDLPPAGGGGKSFSGSKIEKEDAPNAFEENPFK